MADPEYLTEVLSLADAQLQDKIRARFNDGWTIIPGTTPVGIYYWQRLPQTQMIRAAMNIDEAGVTVVKGNGAAT